MLLTLYYMAATWLQSWRLSGIRSKITQLRKNHGSLLLYKDVDSSSKVASTEHQSAETCHIQNLGINSCVNKKDARVGDLLWFYSNKFGISLYPKQILDISEWIGVPGKKTLLPLELSGSRTSSLSEADVLYFVIEADFNALFSPTFTHHCQVEDFGVACAWRAGGFLSLLLESDEEHLAKLTASFMSNSLSFGPGLEIIRVQSVDIKNHPCFLLNADSIPTLHSAKFGNQNVATCRNLWENHISLLKSFSQAASQAARKSEPTPANGHWSAILMPGGEGNFNFNTETEINLKRETKTLELENTMDIVSPVTEQSPVINDISKLKEMSLCSPMAEEPPTTTGNISQEKHKLSDSEVKSSVNEDKMAEQAMEENDRSVSMTSLTAQPGSGEEASTMSSFGSLSRISTDTLMATSPQSRTAQMNGSSAGSLGSLRSISTTSKQLHIRSGETGKPPNIVIFSESSVSVDSVKAALKSTVHSDRYTIYSLTLSEMLSSPWLKQATLVVVCGTVPITLVPLLMQYILHSGGSLLCLCSDLLGVLLPVFKTAEVRPDQLVTFSYSNWKHVRMMHHIFCYQASPSSAKFSVSDEQNSYTASGIPESIEVTDKDNKPYTLNVKVLGVEETWQTPSLIVAQAPSSGGKVVFSQVHLETDPMQYESEEDKLQTLKKSNQVRLEILTDILSSHLGLHCSPKQQDFKYTTAYFLGTHELKQSLMDKLKPHLEGDSLKLQNITLKFCGKGVDPPEATPTLMPILMYSCPQSFSTVAYFENLRTKHLGRLVIYSEVLTTSMHILQGPPLAHGLAVIPCRQTQGVARAGNIWLSPDGCAMFSLQLHIPLKSVLGEHLPIVQHVVALAIVHSISKLPGMKDLGLCLKWPNDMYAKNVKVGGLIISSIGIEDMFNLNIGCGFNLNNKYPTACINDLIQELNTESGSNTPKLSYEQYFALVFTELESLLDQINAGHLEDIIKLYYKYWLHGGAEVDVKDVNGSVQRVTITGINECGFLTVRGKSGEFEVQPDGNSFDMMAGLIAPKIKFLESFF